ncbi:palmitoleoyl-protein carboxylesterase notum1a-like [Takifugu rubripes]|uniref:Notum, palmitoleoyl-protein carboxylesterase n=1 Tax=Takifugu rubripes TaxID=31033 RepID=H2U3J1_TAKRU|nr:palmitoleoyl-protein carboxylesterase notum1a-like [Takifugu rubripes]
MALMQTSIMDDYRCCTLNGGCGFVLMGVMRNWALGCLLLPFIYVMAAGTLKAKETDLDMKLHFLRNNSVTCNDGSPAGYYIRESKGSPRWLLFLEGGWYCISKDTCDSRFQTMKTLMGSSSWSQTRRGRGILSPKPEENPYWWDSNMVFLPYCSSDVWSGTRPKTENDDFAFLGALIIKEVVKELLSKGLDQAEVLILTGSSAGAIGVLVNVDHVAEQLQTLGHQAVQVRGLSDSGWILDRKNYKFGDCLHVLNCGPIDSVKKGIRQWRTIMPEICRRAHIGEEWKCFFGYKIYPTLKSPVFVMEWLFDQAQLMVFNVTLTGQPFLQGEWNYLQSLGTELKSTLLHVSAAFAPSCLAHELINSNSWIDVQIKGTSLPAALHCWDQNMQGNTHINGNRGPSCPQHVIDSCLWPQCNPTCPQIYDQQSGQEISIEQFLEYMEDDVMKIATQQGMMSRDEDWLLS